MRVKIKIILICLAFVKPFFSQNVIDSTSKVFFEKDKGKFSLRVKKFRGEITGGVYRNREGNLSNFNPFSVTYQLLLPFQYDFGYKYFPEKEKIIKINTAFILQHSNHGNYAMGIGLRPSFLLTKHLYLNYQAGVVWCEVVKRNTNDGFNTMGFCFHHQFSLSYSITNKISLSINALHISNGNLFKNVKNVQDVIGIGVGYYVN